MSSRIQCNASSALPRLHSGELRRGLPVGFVWGEEDGEVRFHPDAAVTSAIRTVFARFAELGESAHVSALVRDPDRNVIELRGRDQGVIGGVSRYEP
jgi:hypothetical protein